MRHEAQMTHSTLEFMPPEGTTRKAPLPSFIDSFSAEAQYEPRIDLEMIEFRIPILCGANLK